MVSALLLQLAPLAPQAHPVLQEFALVSLVVCVRHYQRQALALTQISARLALCAESLLILTQQVLCSPLQLS